MTLGFPFGSKNFCKFLCVSWEVFCFARIRLDPLSGQVLHHDCISMIVSRFTLFTKNFMVCCYQSPNCSARGTTVPVSFLQGALVILVLKQMSQFRSFEKLIYIYIYIYCACPIQLFLAALKLTHKRNRRCVPVFWNAFIHKILRIFF